MAAARVPSFTISASSSWISGASGVVRCASIERRAVR